MLHINSIPNANKEGRGPKIQKFCWYPIRIAPWFKGISFHSEMVQRGDIFERADAGGLRKLLIWMTSWATRRSLATLCLKLASFLALERSIAAPFPSVAVSFFKKPALFGTTRDEYSWTNLYLMSILSRGCAELARALKGGPFALQLFYSSLQTEGLNWVSGSDHPAKQSQSRQPLQQRIKKIKRQKPNSAVQICKNASH